MSAEPVIDLAQRVYRYRHGWILLDPRLATGRQHMRGLESAEERRAGVSKPFTPSPRQARPSGATRFRHGAGQNIAIDVAERRGLRQAENREKLREAVTRGQAVAQGKPGRDWAGFSSPGGSTARNLRKGDRVRASYEGGIAGLKMHDVVAADHSGGRTKLTTRDPNTGRTHTENLSHGTQVTMQRSTAKIDRNAARAKTSRKATRAFGDANARYSGNIAQVADKMTASLRGKSASRSKHLGAARLHAAAAKWQSATPAEAAHHTRLAAMHRGIAQRTASIAAANTGPALELARHVPVDPKIKLGSGGRFKKLKSRLAARGARNPGALAAFIGRRAYGAKKFGQLSHGHAHSNITPALELADMTRYPKLAVSSPYDVMVIRSPDGQAIIRHRQGGYEIARLRREPDGSWIAAVDGRDLTSHTRQRGALLEAIGIHNKSTGSPYHRPEPASQPGPQRSEPLQPPPVQTELMRAVGIEPIRLATPARGASDGPRVTGSGPAGDVAGLSPRGATIYKKLRGRNFPHARAHAFARRAQNKAAGK
jgi:hypothetical protein